MVDAKFSAVSQAKRAQFYTAAFRKNIEAPIAERLTSYVRRRRLTCQDVIKIADHLEHFSFILTIDSEMVISAIDQPQELRKVLRREGLTMAFVQQQLKFLIPRVLSRDVVGIEYCLKFASDLSQQGFPNEKILARLAGELGNFRTVLPGGSDRVQCLYQPGGFEYQGERLQRDDEFNRLRQLYESGRAVTLEEITNSSFAQARKEYGRTNSVRLFGNDTAIKHIEIEEAIDKAIARLTIDPREILKLMFLPQIMGWEASRSSEYLELRDRILYPIYREMFLSEKYTRRDLT